MVRSATTVTLLFVAPLLAQTPALKPVLPVAVDSPRPLVDLKKAIQERFGKPVSYEETFLLWDGETEPIGGSGDRAAKNLRFTIPGDASPPMDLAAFANAGLDAYHQQTSGPRYRLAASSLGLHLIPAQVRNSAGTFAPAGNPLDVTVLVPKVSRTPAEHFVALRDAIAAASGVPLLLTRSATTYTWELRCRNSTRPADRFCVLSLAGVEVLVIEAGGSSSRQALLFDRCGKCPPLPGR